MKLLALLHSPAASGSDTTVRRIAAHLADSGHSVLLTPLPADPEALARLAKKYEIDALIGVHALLAGEPFLEVGLPYVLVLGGTDVNEYAQEREYRGVLGLAVERASALVAFNEDFVERCVALWPPAAERVRLIPQGVRTIPSDFSLRSHLGLDAEAKLFLLPSGLRLVKDPLFLVDCFRQWHEEDPRIHLVISGLSYDEDFEGIVRRRCGTGDAVRYLGTLDRGDLHAAMREATAVLNTSVSECSPNSLLEAMDLGRPVLVRAIPGNLCLVEPGFTGLAFHDPEGFRAEAQRLLDDELFAEQLGRRGQDFVRAAHSPVAERAAYAALVRDLLDEFPPEVDAANRDRMVRRGEVELCVQTFGDPADPAVLLVAGSGASMLAWETEFCERLAAGARYVIRYDHRDTGRSTASAPGEPRYTLRDLADDAVGVLEALDVTAAHVVGISLGGMIAQLAALEHPDRVASLALLSTSPGSGDDLPPTPLSVLVDLDDVDLPDWSDRGSVVEYQVASARILAGGARPFDEIGARRLAGRSFDRAAASRESATNHLFLDRGTPWRHRLGAVDVPTLVVHGSDDPIHPPAHARALAAEIPDSTLIILDRAGHELARADWAEVLGALLAHTEKP